MSELRLIFRNATLADAETLLAWRNDAITRQQSVNMDLISRENHLKWLSAVLGRESQVLLLIAEFDNTAIGTVRIDRNETESELSWTINPSVRGRGFGTEMVKQATKLAEGDLFARVKDDNAASKKIAVSAGFKLAYSRGGMEHWHLRRAKS